MKLRGHNEEKAIHAVILSFASSIAKLLSSNGIQLFPPIELASMRRQ